MSEITLLEGACYTTRGVALQHKAMTSDIQLKYKVSCTVREVDASKEPIQTESGAQTGEHPNE